tara:strand:- start:14 stop:346 length:333 start_codon:yes stop_codon:yes gene_type:complete
MQLKGIITAIKEVQVISEKFKKQEVILNQAGVEYDAEVPVEFVQDKGIELVQSLKVGSSYEIEINVSGRAWKDRHFVSLKGWKVKELEASAEVAQATPDIGYQSGDGMPF